MDSFADLPRSSAFMALHGANQDSKFRLQRCGECRAFLYPARDACPHCWSAEIAPEPAPRGGTLLSDTLIRASFEPCFREGPPARIGIIQLDCGPVAMTFVDADSATDGRVRLSWRKDPWGYVALQAEAVKEFI